jgi:DNA polymerase-4
VNRAAAARPRTIVHADMDAFYAAVEQLDDPALRGRPLLIGHDSPRSVVLTASYEARPYGVGSAMSMARARQLCPRALIVPPRFERYQQVSSVIMELFGTFSPQVEPLSLDEAFLDMTGSERLFGAPRAIGERIKTAVREGTGGLTVSVGVASTRYVAKVASGFGKPDGLTIVAPERAKEWLAPLPVASLWGAGPKTARRLQALGFENIGQVARADIGLLRQSFGELGRRFHELANAIDPRVVVSARRPQSVGSERTLVADVSKRREIEAHLRAAADTVAQRLRQRGAQGRGVRVKLKRADFRVVTRQGTLPAPSDVGVVLFDCAARLLGEVADPGPFRLVGLAAFDLSTAQTPPQLSLIPATGDRARRLETAIDSLVERFGAGAVQRAADLGADRRAGASANLDFLEDYED